MIFRMLFGKTPQPGEIYRLNDDPYHIHRARVVGIKNGYVLFDWIFEDVLRGSKHSSRHSETVRTFRYTWRLEATAKTDSQYGDKQ